jgi:hypothetical protein
LAAAATSERGALPTIVDETSVQTTGVAAIAVIVSFLPLHGIDRNWSAAIRAILFLVCCAILLCPSGAVVVPRSEFSRASAVVAGALLLIVGTAIPGRETGWSMAAAVMIASAVEELVFRCMLPQKLAWLATTTFGERRATWIGIVAAQLCFAMSHAAIAIAHEHTLSVLAVVRLAGLGFFLTSLRVLGGLPVAIAAHTTANVALITPTPPLAQIPSTTLLILCAAGVIFTVGAVAMQRRSHSAGTLRQASCWTTGP